MKVRYVGHACLSIEAAGQRVLTDPWWDGGAYTGQWYPYPTPRVEREDLEGADFIYISHGHEDHLHLPTLKAIDKRAKLVIPRYRDPGMHDFLDSLGFAQVIEIGHGQTRELAPGLEATIYTNKDDSILVLRGDGRTLVDANDALHACSRHVIDHLCEQIRKRHRRIDSLFLGYGGASWYPNCMQLTDAPAFDAERREEILSQNFAYVARSLRAAMAFPFAASFALLEDHLQWINDVRLRMQSPVEELKRQGAFEIASRHLLPGDRIIGDRIVPGDRAMSGSSEAAEEILTTYAAQRAEIAHEKGLDEARIARLLEQLRTNAAQRASRILRAGRRLRCRIDLRDLPQVSFILEAEHDGVHIERCDRVRLAPMVLTTRLEVLEACANEPFGYESMTIGYGATLQLRKRDIQLRGALINLLGRKRLPPTRAQNLALWLSHPWRCFDTWRRDLHWRRLSWRLRHGDVQRWNDLYASDPERWSPLRSEPLERKSA